MTTSSKSESKKPEDSDSDLNKRTGRNVNPIDLLSDPDYTKLLEHFQHAEFTKCKKVLDKLEKRYPEHPEVLEFKDNLQMKLSLENIATTIIKGEKSKKKKVVLNLSVFAIIVIIVFFVSYYILNENVAVKQLEDETALLTSLNYQAEQLLLTGQPQPAAEINERIRTINPEFENLPELIARTDDLLRLEANYQTALNLITENKNNEALVILNEIETEKPGMWDVSQQIASVEISFQIAKYMEEGNAAYQVEKWDQVISAYENALILDPELDDPLMNEQLLKGYLSRIISMLKNEDSSIEDIENAEEYYRKAVAMTPQSKAFSGVRETLQKASSDLLELKLTQIAKVNLEDKNQTETSIAKAVSYMRKAVNIKPENTTLNSDLINAENYQIAFDFFIEMNWNESITNLNLILSDDPNYADGNVRLLLFEAYYALGKEYYSLGLYLDAIRTLEQAEILAWYDAGNLIKLFQVQVLLGDTLGKIADHENAVSYYQYALNAIQVDKRLTNFPAIATKLDEANDFVTLGRYEDAFRAFQEVLKDIDVVYSITEIEISDGVCLAFFANENLSNVNAVLEANNLPTSMTITFGRKLKVPMIKE